MVGVAIRAGPIWNVTLVRHAVVVAIDACTTDKIYVVGDLVCVAVELALIRDVVTACGQAVLRGSVGDVAGIRCLVVVAIIFKIDAFVRNAISVAVCAGAVRDVATVRNAVGVAIRLAFIRNTVVVAILTRAVGDVALVGDTVAVAVIAGPVCDVTDVLYAVGVDNGVLYSLRSAKSPDLPN